MAAKCPQLVRASERPAEVRFQMRPGDFMGFPTPSVAHHLRNPFGEELVYLTGGESREVEIADFPRLGLRLLRTARGAALARVDPLKPIG